VVVGPTGVGKTTTIAKIAANLIMDAKKTGKPRPEMRIITIDRTRVGAVEQLARYGELMSIPVDKAESAEDVRTIYEDCKKVTDAVLIDTSGYSPNDSTHIGQMRAMLDVDGLNPDVYLAISASTKATDLNFIIQNYEPFAFGSIIVTKCDETKKFGNILSVLEEKHKSISYITDGQRVPHNIMKADVVYFLTRLSGFQIDRVHIDDEFGAD
jgi:flagellar biosynthesis protein FlhF